MQIKINFDEIVHSKENNRYSQGVLENEYTRLNKNCKILYDALKRGEKLTGMLVVQRYNMLEYRRRFKDLKDAGIDIKENTLKGGIKVWYIGEQLTNEYFSAL